MYRRPEPRAVAPTPARAGLSTAPDQKGSGQALISGLQFAKLLLNRPRVAVEPLGNRAPGIALASGTAIAVTAGASDSVNLRGLAKLGF